MAGYSAHVDLSGEAGAVLAVTTLVSAALGALALRYSRRAADPAAIARGARPPKLDKKALVALLQATAQEAEAAQVRGVGGGREPALSDCRAPHTHAPPSPSFPAPPPSPGRRV